MSSGTTDAFASARSLFERGQVREAEQVLRRLATGEYAEAALNALVELYTRSQQPAEAVNTLVALTDLLPDQLKYFAYLGSYLERLGQPEAAIRHYSRLLARNPEIASAHYNVALLYRKLRRYREALAAYQRAIDLGIDGVEEVYSNMGVLYSEMRNEDKARQMFEQAIEIDPQFVPALFNLAGLFEELGDRVEAVDLYERILGIEPRHRDALARLAQASNAPEGADDTIRSLQQAIHEEQDNAPARESLLFALGSVLDKVGRYDEAFEAYRTANELGRQRQPVYDRVAAEEGIEILQSFFDTGRIEALATGVNASPVFVCGMFRSGSSLVEQMLAAHPEVTAGGELEFLPRLVSGELLPYPGKLQELSGTELERLANNYLQNLEELFPGARHVTDKKPDNFLHLGLVRCLFPSARIIYTKRNKADNCLSVFFQQLGGNLAYATDLGNTSHYFDLQERLMAHWQSCFGERIHTVDYDELVASPEPVLRRMFEFLGLEWHAGSLDFHALDSPVKTASVWQVRQPLHTASSGRRQNYRKFLEREGLDV